MKVQMRFDCDVQKTLSAKRTSPGVIQPVTYLSPQACYEADRSLVRVRHLVGATTNSTFMKQRIFLSPYYFFDTILNITNCLTVSFQRSALLRPDF